ncbi:PREDICTED: CASP-like protein 1E2 [Nelumbo nucifera]|uniref:CASP-like protein n=2 Tax=Nelumbo nucifera TaxID=4432 RepID=A0A1U7YXS9_NELNU|nr:PREDICTED: CASP-like protein 1E2 [Nelumbo nucifera]
MESSQTQYKAANTVEGKGGIESGGKGTEVANPRGVRSSDFLLRLLALATTLVAATVMGVARETKVVSFPLLPNLSPYKISVTAKSRYSSALVYFLVSNAIACAYAALSLLLSLAKQAGTDAFSLAIIVLDVMMVGLLFSGNGAAAAIGVVGYEGNSHANWQKVCDVFGTYCRQVTASIVVSLIGSLLFLLLVVLGVLNLRRRSY